MEDLASLITFLLDILTFAIVGRAILSWFDPAFRTTIGRIIYDITEPIIRPIRQVLPSVGVFDFSPIIAIVIIQLVLKQLVNSAFG